MLLFEHRLHLANSGFRRNLERVDLTSDRAKLDFDHDNWPDHFRPICVKPSRFHHFSHFLPWQKLVEGCLAGKRRQGLGVKGVLSAVAALEVEERVICSKKGTADRASMAFLREALWLFVWSWT
jgi:hypothetical protein